MSALRRYLTTGAGRPMIEDLLKRPDPDRPASLVLSAAQLNAVGLHEVWPHVLLQPEKALAACDRALARACQDVYAELEDRSDCSVKTKVHFRLSDLPREEELSRSTVPRGRDAGLFLALRATVVKVGAPKMLETAKTFACAKCGHTFLLRADYDTYYGLERPAACPGASRCTGTNFQAVRGADANLEFCRDFQEIKVQEQVTKPHFLCVPW